MSKQQKFYTYLSWEHKGWGDAINVMSWDDDGISLSGHLQRKPERGDRVIFKMKSEQLGEVEITNVKYMQDPKDMWFADAKPLDYISQEALDKRLEKQQKDEPKFSFLI